MSEPLPVPTEPELQPPPAFDPALLGQGYVERPDEKRQHRCDLPAEWLVGAVWQCWAGHLWVVRSLPDRSLDTPGIVDVSRSNDAEWRPAGWRLRRKHGGIKARASMADPSVLRRNGPRSVQWLAAHPEYLP